MSKVNTYLLSLVSFTTGSTYW